MRFSAHWLRQVVRTLSLEQKPAGYDLGQGKAAYWDGRNENREPAASGVYFYLLQTETFSAVRKMVVVK